jgi:hypothetical protein
MPNPQRGVAYSFRISLLDSINPGRIKKSPTIVAGDFKISIDGGVLNNLTTLPTELPAASGCITVSLTAVEMLGDKIQVVWSDPEFEWGDGYVFFDAPTNILTNNDYNAIGVVQMVESYAADGVAPTRDQMLFMIWSAVSQFIITGTLINAKRLDGITDAMQFTMDHTTTPTQRIRTS